LVTRGNTGISQQLIDKLGHPVGSVYGIGDIFIRIVPVSFANAL
jgi:hypothetical protein